MNVRGILVAVTATGVLTSAVSAPAATGVTGFYGAQATWDDTDPSASPNGNPQIPYSGASPFSASYGASEGNASASVAINARSSNGNLGLHGTAIASAFGGHFQGGGGGAFFDIYTYDGFHITGDGVEQFQFTATLDGSANAASDTDFALAYGGYGLFVNSNWIGPGTVTPFDSCTYTGAGYELNGNPCGRLSSIDLNTTTPHSQTVTGVIDLEAGTDVQFGEFLWSRTFGGGENMSASFDAANTGYFTLTALTPGAGFTTDSGLTYANDPDAGVPEPAGWALMVLGFAGAGVAIRRRRGAMA
jgi:hypothetical protein